MTASDGFCVNSTWLELCHVGHCVGLIWKQHRKLTHHLFDYSMLPNVLVLTIKWGEDETHLFKYVTWDGTMLKSCCPKSGVWVEASWVGFMWGMMILAWETCMLPIMWAWPHGAILATCLLNLLHPWMFAMGILSSVMGMPVGFCHWHPWGNVENVELRCCPLCGLS